MISPQTKSHLHSAGKQTKRQSRTSYSSSILFFYLLIFPLPPSNSKPFFHDNSCIPKFHSNFQDASETLLFDKKIIKNPGKLEAPKTVQLILKRSLTIKTPDLVSTLTRRPLGSSSYPLQARGPGSSEFCWVALDEMKVAFQGGRVCFAVRGLTLRQSRTSARDNRSGADGARPTGCETGCLKEREEIILSSPWNQNKRRKSNHSAVQDYEVSLTMRTSPKVQQAASAVKNGAQISSFEMNILFVLISVFVFKI